MALIPSTRGPNVHLIIGCHCTPETQSLFESQWKASILNICWDSSESLWYCYFQVAPREAESDKYQLQLDDPGYSSPPLPLSVLAFLASFPHAELHMQPLNLKGRHPVSQNNNLNRLGKNF